MNRARIAITIDPAVLKDLDLLVASKQFQSRSQAIEEAVSAKLRHLSRGRLARECARLDPGCEQAMADEGMSAEMSEWSVY